MTQDHVSSAIEPSRADAIREGISRALQRDLETLEIRLTGGGAINQTATAMVDDQAIFIKWNDRPLPKQFSSEAAGLDALRKAESGLVVPKVIAHNDSGPGRSFLAMEQLAKGERGADFDARFGRGLAALHRVTSARGFGFPTDGYCGATPQPNRFTKRWAEFYQEERLHHQLRMAAENGLSATHRMAIERLIDRVGEWIVEGEPPALIHGDLWSGNLIASDRGPALVDPAAYFGNREAEFGMMVLFGGFSKRVYDAYNEVWPLEQGYEERLPLYSLYHLLNHFNLFGGDYGLQAVAIARRFAS